MTNLAALVDALAPHLASRTTDDWLKLLEAAGVPAGPVLNIAEMHRDPQAIARDMVVSAEHSRLGPVKTLGLPVKFSATPGGVLRGAPLYGESAEASQFHSVPARQSVRDLVENCTDDALNVTVIEVRIQPRHALDQLGFRHGVAP